MEVVSASKLLKQFELVFAAVCIRFIFLSICSFSTSRKEHILETDCHHGGSGALWELCAGRICTHSGKWQ